MKKIILEIDLTNTSDRWAEETMELIQKEFVNQNIVSHNYDILNKIHKIHMEWLNKGEK